MITLLIALTALGAGLYLIKNRQPGWGAAGVLLGVFLLAPGLLHLAMVAIENLLTSSAPLLAALAALGAALWGLRFMLLGR